MFPSVKAWVDSDYKLVSVKKRRIDAAGLDYSGLTIWNLAESSPAHIVGLKEGDILFTINGHAPFNADMEKPRQRRKSFGSHKFEFYRPNTEEIITLKAKQWSFGIQLRTSQNEYSRDLRIGDPDLDDMENYWRNGALESIGSFYEAWEVMNHRLLHMDGESYFKTDFILPHHNQPLAGDLWHSNFAYLALSAACAKKYKRARYVLDEIHQRIAESDSGFPCIAASMMHYTESMLSEAQGNNDEAVLHMHNAIDAAWEISENYLRLGKLTGQTITMPSSPYEEIKLSYALPIEDPAGIIEQHAGHLDLQTICKNLKPDQFIIVVLLSSYRSNYYYDKGWQMSAPILSKLRSIFPYIHIVTSGKYSLDNSFLKAEDYLTQEGLEFKVLYDEGDNLAKSLNLERAPTNLVLDHNGEIVAESALWDESLIWKAIASLRGDT